MKCSAGVSPASLPGAESKGEDNVLSQCVSGCCADLKGRA